MQGCVQATCKCYTIFCKDQGHLRINTLRDSCGSLPPPDWQIRLERHLENWTSFLEGSPLPFHTDLGAPNYSTSFWGHSGPRWSLSPWTQQRVGALSDETRLEITKVSQLSAWEKADTSRSSSVPHTRLGSNLGHRMRVNRPQRTLQTRFASRRGTFFECFFFLISYSSLCYTQQRASMKQKVILIQLHYRKT